MTRGGVPAVDPDELASDLAYLKRNGARFLTFDNLRTGQFPSKQEWGIIVTFDDCFHDNYAQGIEVLSTLGIKAVFFQTSGLVDGKELIWEHQLYWYIRNDQVAARFIRSANAVLTTIGLAPIAHLNDIAPTLRDRIPLAVTAEILKKASTDAALTDSMPQLPAGLYPSSQQVCKARRAGHEIGSHGHLHLKRSNISPEQFRFDLERSKTALTDVIGEAPASYSFPFSDFGPGDVEICRMMFDVVASVERKRLIDCPEARVLAPRFTWPGPARNDFRKRRWLLTGTI
jgi:peptidoglycan/xylan/chitin deacetylase (PgdA/CDA1 family)